MFSRECRSFAAIPIVKVMALGLRNCLLAMVGKGLQEYIPKDFVGIRGQKSLDVALSVPWSDRPTLKSCMDEEAVGFKMMNFLAGPCGLRVYPEPEGSHPMWNNFLSAIDQSNLKAVLLKATLFVNWTRGPFGSGAHQCRLTDAAKHLMESKGTKD